LTDNILIYAFAGVAFIPVKSRYPLPVDHICILPPYTKGVISLTRLNTPKGACEQNAGFLYRQCGFLHLGVYYMGFLYSFSSRPFFS
jgi:hypothetical protein